MDERLVTELETAIADAGALLVRAQKYRRGAGTEGSALLAATMRLGDTARRLSRQDALDDAAAIRLRAGAEQLSARVRALVDDVRASAEYTTAVVAHAAGDQETLGRTLPAVFHGLERASAPPALFHPVTWRRRNRPRSAAEVIAEVARVRAEGLAAEGDDLSAGTDGALPAVVLQADAPADEPLALRLSAGGIAVPVYRLVETGEYLTYVPRLRAPMDVLLARALGPDALESAPLDYARYREELAAALVAAAIPFIDV